jgi:hypothetical protein
MRKQTEAWQIATAYHEAGHAVVAHAVGLNVTEVKITERLDGRSEGRTTAPPIADPPQIEDQVAVLVAGMIAVRKFAISIPVAGDDEREKLLELLSRAALLRRSTSRSPAPASSIIFLVARAARSGRRALSRSTRNVTTSASTMLCVVWGLELRVSVAVRHFTLVIEGATHHPTTALGGSDTGWVPTPVS